MSCRKLPPALLIVAVLGAPAGWAESALTLKSVKVNLPDDSEMFTGDGSDPINNNCLACHSASMVLTQPALPKAVWQAEVEKMIHAYKAPVADEDVAAIVDYLARTKGTK
jgi:mono/diheme cytochrome c family protein